MRLLFYVGKLVAQLQDCPLLHDFKSFSIPLPSMLLSKLFSVQLPSMLSRAQFHHKFPHWLHWHLCTLPRITWTSFIECWSSACPSFSLSYTFSSESAALLRKFSSCRDLEETGLAGMIPAQISVLTALYALYALNQVLLSTRHAHASHSLGLSANSFAMKVFQPDGIGGHHPVTGVHTDYAEWFVCPTANF